MRGFNFKNAKYKSARRRLILLSCAMALIFCSSACSLFPKESELTVPTLAEPAKVDYKYDKVCKGTIAKSISGDGVIVPEIQQEVSFENRGGILKDLMVKAGDTVKKGQVIADLDSDNLSSDIKLEQVKLEKAQLIYEDMVNKKCSNIEIQQAQLDVQIEQIQLENLQQQLDKSTLVSPVNGRIVKIEDVELGQNVEMYQPIVLIADSGKMEIEYTGDRVKDMKIGMKVDITEGQKKYGGEVVSVVAGQASSDASTQTNQYARIRADQFPASSQFGDNVHFTIELSKKENVLIIPKNSVKNSNGYTYVLVIDDNNKTVEKFIQTGLDDDNNIEVISGLKEGEKVVQ